MPIRKPRALISFRIRDEKLHEKAIVVAERVRMMVEKTKIALNGDTDLDITVSCGVSTAVPGKNGNDPDRLLKAADMGLYKAKEEGRKRVSARDTDSLS